MIVFAIGESDCEFLGDGAFAQPVNTVTSLAYVVVGAWIAVTGVRNGGRRSRTAVTFGALLVAVGVGSVAFHGPQPSGARLLHDVPIVLAAAFVAVVTAARVRSAGFARRAGRRAIGLLAVVFVAAAAWIFGRTASPLCDPDAAFQFHGMWHVLSAAALAGWWSLVGVSPDDESGTYAGVETRG